MFYTLKSLKIKLANKKYTKSIIDTSKLFERISDAFFALDNDWNYVYINKASLMLHDIEEKNIIGKNIWTLYPELVGSEFYDILLKAKETQEAQQSEFYYTKTSKWYRNLVYPDADGISLYYSDITERKKTKEAIKNSEEALRLSNERFEYLAKATNDATWDWNLEKDILIGDETYCDLLEIDLDEKLNYQKFNDRVHPDDREEFLKNFKSALKNKETVLKEQFRIVQKDGTIKVINDRAYIFYNEEGKGYRMIGAMQDITELKATEQKLIAEKEVSDHIINTLPGIFYLFNKEGKYLRWNKNLEKISGYSGEEILNLNPLSFTEVQDITLLKEKIENVFASGNDFIEATFVTKEGRIIPYYFSGEHIKFENEDCLIGVGFDLTEKNEIQKALMLSEKKYKLLFEETPISMWIVDIENNKCLDVNKSAIKTYGYSKEAFLKLPITGLHPNSNPDYKIWKALAIDSAQRKIKEWLHQKKDGTIINVSIQTSDIMYDGIKAVLVMANDISASAKAKAELKKSQSEYRELATQIETIRENERTKMAREIHDELGQQLTGLKMDISWISKKVKSEDLAIKEKMRDIVELIDKTVITVRRISTELRPSILDDLGLVSAMDWQSEEFEKRFEIKSTFKSNVPHIKLSEEVATNVFRIYQESLTNVSRHAQATKVAATLTIENNFLKLTIEDNGIGFNENNIVHKKTLGLLGMKERVLLIGGTYEFKSNNTSGTSINISVPLIGENKTNNH